MLLLWACDGTIPGAKCEGRHVQDESGRQPSHLDKLSTSLIKPMFQCHKDKVSLQSSTAILPVLCCLGCQAFVANCVVDILRLYAPSPPYSQPQLKVPSYCVPLPCSPYFLKGGLRVVQQTVVQPYQRARRCSFQTQFLYPRQSGSLIWYATYSVYSTSGRLS